VTFTSPYLLLVLLLVPAAVAAAAWLSRRPARHATAFTNLDVLAAVVERRRRTLLPFALFVLALAAAAVVLAGPHLRTTTVARHATVILVVDVSGSMNATDVVPSRLGAAEEALAAFTARVPRSVRVGLVSFSGSPTLLVPPTVDRNALRAGIGELDASGGTAIGDALRLAVAVAVGAARAVPAGRHPAAIVLLSDGAQTAGSLTPLEGASLARAARIPVDTVALGTFGRPSPLGPVDAYGFMLTFKPDPVTLAAIAADTGGRTYRVGTAARAVGVYRSLGRSVVRSSTNRAIASWFSGLAALLLLGSLAAARRSAPALP